MDTPQIPDAAVYAAATAMQNAVITDDEGEFPRLFDMLDFSGENKAVTVTIGLAQAAIYAAAPHLMKSDYRPLVEFFRTEGAEMGHKGDYELWPPEQTAIHFLREHLSCTSPEPIPMFLTCPGCGTRHIDEGEFATKAHHTHACQGCGMVWRPALVPTVGVQFLPGFKNDV